MSATNSEAVACPGPDAAETKKNPAAKSDKVVSTKGDQESTNLVENQKDGVEDALIKVALKPFSGQSITVEVDKQDNVMDLRAVLMDSADTSYFTHFNFRLDNGEIVSDFAEVGSLLPEPSATFMILHMAEACYDERSARTHVKRLKEILAPPQVTPGSALFTLLPSSNASGELVFPGSDPDDNASTPLLVEALEAAAADPNPSLAAVASYDFGSDLTLREQPCLKLLALSPLGAPTPARRLQGDLAYYDVVLCDDRRCCITACTRGFFLNKTPAGAPAIVPAMDNAAQLSYSLVGLLNQISPSFKRNFARLLAARSQRDPFELTPNNVSFTPWVAVPGATPAASTLGAEDPLLSLVHGMEVGVNARDWNEEHQSCRDLPRESSRERQVAERTLYKVACDFHDAATRGAAAIVERCIPPLNPMEPETSHMYVYNSIFFSFAAEGRDAAAAAAAAAAASAASGEESQGELATYASANQDLDGVIRLAGTDTPGLHTLATAVVDYRGHRVVAQSIVPGILQCDQMRTLVHGPVEAGKRFLFHSELHERLAAAASKLHMKPHRLVDAEGKEHPAVAPGDCKGILGCDGRTYLMDMVRVTPRDPNYVRPDAAAAGGAAGVEPGEEGVLRWELVRNYCRLKELEQVAANAAANEAAGEAAAKTKPEVPPLELNVDAVAGARSPDAACWRLAGTEAELAADRKAVEEVAEFLTARVIPSVVQRCRDMELMPMDGAHLVELLHQEGINVRYLGRVIEAAEAAPAPYLKQLARREVLARAAKHVFRAALRRTGPSHLAAATARLLNCLFGSVPKPKDSAGASSAGGGSGSGAGGKGKKKNRGAAVAGGKAAIVDLRGPAFEVGSEDLWAQLREDASRRYGHQLPEDRAALLAELHGLPTLRAVAAQSGAQLAPREYDLRAQAPFTPEDVTDLFPRSKSTLAGQPREARELLELGRTVFELGHLAQAYDMLRRALASLQGASGPLHPDAATVHSLLGLISSASQDHAAALSHHQRALSIHERVRGWDHPEAAQAYAGMGRAALALARPRRALAYFRRAEMILALAAGPAHPACARVATQVAGALQALGAGRSALRALHRATAANEAGLGLTHPITAMSYRATASALAGLDAFPLAARNEQRCLEVLRKQLGEEHEQVKESQRLLTQYTAHAKLHNSQVQGVAPAPPAGPGKPAAATPADSAPAPTPAPAASQPARGGKGKKSPPPQTAVAASS